MRDLLDYEPGAGIYQKTPIGRTRLTKYYREYETLVPDWGGRPVYIVAYHMRSGEDLLCVANVDVLFRGFLRTPSEEPDRTRHLVLLRLAMEQAPIFGSLIQNAAHAHFTNGALLRVPDPDDRTSKWSVGTVVGNLSAGPHSSSEEVFDENMRALNGISKVQTTALQLLYEWDRVEIDRDRLIREISSADLRRDFRRTLEWLDRNKESLLRVLVGGG